MLNFYYLRKIKFPGSEFVLAPKFAGFVEMGGLLWQEEAN